MNLDRVEKYTPEMLSVVRIVIALLFLEHGSAKLLGFPPSPHGEPAVMTLMWIQGLIELVGGFLLFFVAGPGRWSLDAELAHDYRRGDYRVRSDHYGERTAQAARGR